MNVHQTVQLQLMPADGEQIQYIGDLTPWVRKDMPASRHAAYLQGL